MRISYLMLIWIGAHRLSVTFEKGCVFLAVKPGISCLELLGHEVGAVSAADLPLLLDQCLDRSFNFARSRAHASVSPSRLGNTWTRRVE
jgi:hypothetical protein